MSVVAAETDERDALLTWLDAQRTAVRRAASGLTDEQASATPSASALSVAGLVKHLASVEFSWIHVVMGGRTHPVPMSPETWGDNFRLVGDETLAGMLDWYGEVAKETDEFVRSLPSLDQTYELPKRPWYPDEPRSARWILLTMIQETARHAGHADVIRESVDGATAYELDQL